MKRTILLSAIIFLQCALLKAQTTISLSPTKDASIGFHDGYPSDDTNYGNATHYSAFSQPSAAFATGENAGWGIMDFDWSAIPEGATIVNAKLKLYHFGSGFSGPLPSGHAGNNKSFIVRIKQNWNESTVTWNTKPATTSTHKVTVPKSTSANEDYTHINVTDIVQDIVDHPDQGFGFCLKLKNETPTAGLLFASTDFADASRWPVLVVTYTTGTEGRKADTEISVAPSKDAMSLKIYPNPAVNVFQAEINLETAANVSWELKDITGKLYMSQSMGRLEKGVTAFDISLDKMDLGSGIYLFTLIADNRTQTIKINIE